MHLLDIINLVLVIGDQALPLLLQLFCMLLFDVFHIFLILFFRCLKLFWWILATVFDILLQLIIAILPFFYLSLFLLLCFVFELSEIFFNLFSFKLDVAELYSQLLYFFINFIIWRSWLKLEQTSLRAVHFI